MPDVVDDSNTATGNPVARVLSDCDSLAVPAWTAPVRTRWQHWKDHFFLVVADAFAPTGAVPSSCGSCLTVNGSGQYAAVVLYGGAALSGQVRDAPPIDADTVQDVTNYLEGNNVAALQGIGTDLSSAPANASFNDLLFCVDTALNVLEC